MSKKRQKVRSALILISFLLFPITMNYFSPYIIIDGASQGIVVGSFITFTFLFLFSLFLGRAFCGWVCPIGGLQDWCSAVNNKKARGGKFNWIKYFIWIPWISIIIIAAISAKGFHRINPLHLIETGISISEPANYMMYYTIIGLIVVLALTAGKRAFCHYGCWIAPFMILGTKIKDLIKLPSLHLAITNAKCEQCKTCNKHCPMSLDINKMVQTGSMKNSECILCGNCVDNCPNQIIKYSFKRR